VSAYRRFRPGEILTTVVHARPRTILASGSAGWRGNHGTSGSVSLHGGVRSRHDVRPGDIGRSGISVYPLDVGETHTIDGVKYFSGSYPMTASVRLVKVRNSQASQKTHITDADWYEEHFSVVDRLFQHYGTYRPEYFTGSYDHYSLYLKSTDGAAGEPCVLFYDPDVSANHTIADGVRDTGTFEIFVKPSVTGSRDQVLISQLNKFRFYITGSDGKVAFTDNGRSYLTSSSPVVPGIWNHVAFAFGASSASFYLNGILDSSQLYTGTLPFNTVTASMIVGARTSGVTRVDGLRGFVFDSRVWNVKRTTAQIASTISGTLVNSSSAGLLHYARFNDGPLGPINHSHATAIGSGVLDHSLYAVHGVFDNVNETLPVGPIWQPNDHPTFLAKKTAIRSHLDFMKVLHVPSIFYGRQIATGSLRMVCRAYDAQGIVRVLRDDGRGNVYVSGSITREIGGEDYRGNVWRKVGNVFYDEGIVALTDPSLFDFGELGLDHDGPADPLQVEFEGVTRTLVKTFMCRLPAGELNCSNNPTFFQVDDNGTPSPQDDRALMRNVPPVTYVTTVVLYDNERRPVAVARLAQPIRKREKDSLDIRLRFDI
jgi:hypothetical protein